MSESTSQNFLERMYKKMGVARTVVIFGLLFIISQLSIAMIISSLGPENMLTLQTTFSKEVFKDILEKWGSEGIQTYKKHFYIDFFHPFIYGIFLSSFFAFLTAGLRKKSLKLYLVVFLLPLIAGLCDIIENTLHLILLSNIDNLSEIMIWISAAFCNLKWLLAFLSTGIILFIILLRVKSGAAFSESKRE